MGGAQPPRLEPLRECVTVGAETPVAPDVACAVPSPAARHWLTRQGVSVYDCESQARTTLRLQARPVLERVQSKRAQRPAWDAVSQCGRVVAQAGITGETLVAGRIVSTRCGLHKLCPVCSQERSREKSEALRCWVKGRQDDPEGGEVLVTTLTQLKKARRRESAEVAFDRFTASLQKLRSGTKAKREPDRAEKPERWANWWFRTLVRGGMRSLEATYSHAGDKNDDGSVVRFSGFHVHAHAGVELHDPPPWWVAEHYGETLPTLPPRPEVWALILEEWRAFAMERIIECWREVSPIHESQSQGAKEYGGTGITMDGCHADVADRGRLYQMCKYATKPVKLSEADLADADAGDHANSKFWAQVELLTAIQDRKMQSGWGTWRHWQRAHMEDSEDEREPVEVEASELQDDDDQDDELGEMDGPVQPEKWLPVMGDLGTVLEAERLGVSIETRPRKGEPCHSVRPRPLLELIRQRLKLHPSQVVGHEIVKVPQKERGFNWHGRATIGTKGAALTH